MAAKSLYRVGQRVQELAPPHRKGTVKVVNGRGSYASIWVQIDGRGIVRFTPSGLSII